VIATEACKPWNLPVPPVSSHMFVAPAGKA
jgi:hypothetical protein